MGYQESWNPALGQEKSNLARLKEVVQVSSMCAVLGVTSIVFFDKAIDLSKKLTNPLHNHASTNVSPGGKPKPPRNHKRDEQRVVAQSCVEHPQIPVADFKSEVEENTTGISNPPPSISVPSAISSVTEEQSGESSGSLTCHLGVEGYVTFQEARKAISQTPVEAMPTPRITPDTHGVVCENTLR